MQIVYNKTNSFKIDDLIIKYYYTEEKKETIMVSINCKKCGKRISSDEEVCFYCGEVNTERTVNDEVITENDNAIESIVSNDNAEIVANSASEAVEPKSVAVESTDENTLTAAELAYKKMLSGDSAPEYNSAQVNADSNIESNSTLVSGEPISEEKYNEYNAASVNAAENVNETFMQKVKRKALADNNKLLKSVVSALVILIFIIVGVVIGVNSMNEKKEYKAQEQVYDTLFDEVQEGVYLLVNLAEVWEVTGQSKLTKFKLASSSEGRITVDEISALMMEWYGSDEDAIFLDETVSAIDVAAEVMIRKGLFTTCIANINKVESNASKIKNEAFNLLTVEIKKDAEILLNECETFYGTYEEYTASSTLKIDALDDKFAEMHAILVA